MWYVVMTLILVNQNVVSAPPPMRLTIDCGSREKDSLFHGTQLRAKPPSLFNNRADVNINSFCDLLENAIPKAVKDGKFVLLESEDQMGFGDTISPVTLSPPRGFIPRLPKFRKPKLRVPKIPVPNLRSFEDGTRAPRIGSPMIFKIRKVEEEESSAEKMEKFKKGVQKMLHFVKVLGQIDNYLSERTRIIIDKLSKTFSE